MNISLAIFELLSLYNQEIKTSIKATVIDTQTKQNLYFMLTKAEHFT